MALTSVFVYSFIIRWPYMEVQLFITKYCSTLSVAAAVNEIRTKQTSAMVYSWLYYTPILIGCYQFIPKIYRVFYTSAFALFW